MAAGPHSLGVTQSLMYAFSRACMVFTTANSSAMLSYLRRACLSGQGHQAPRARHHPTGCRYDRVLTHALRTLGVKAAQGGSVGLRGWAGGQPGRWTHFSRSRAFLYSFTSCWREGQHVGTEGVHMGTYCGSAPTRQVPVTHLIQLWLVSRGCNRASRAGSRSTTSVLPETTPRLCPRSGGADTLIGAP